jgi:hypothetical protein
MRSVFLAALAALATTPLAVQAQDQAAPPIRVWLNRTDFQRSDKAKAYLQTQDDGYVVVLNADPTGRVRVLFPLDPGDDDYVQGGKDYEIRGRSDREAFVVYQSEGTGYVYAAVSRDPFQFDGLALNGQWDYRAADWAVGADPEADLTALVQKMVGSGTFDYDIARYDVGYNASPAVGLSMYDPYYGGLYPYWYGGSRFSINVGFGLWPSAYWWDPWYDPWYSPWYWGGCCYAGLGWYGYQPFGYGYFSPWYGPRHVGTVYYAGNFGSPFVFKSHNDRWGLGPQPFGVRQRTPAPRTVLAGGTGVLWNGDFGRRTVTRAGPGGRVQPASGGRRVAPQGATNLGTMGPARRPAPARQPEIVPSAPRSGARPAPRQTRDGSTDLGRIGPTRRAAPAQQGGARPSTPLPTQRPAPRATPRGLRVDNGAPAPPPERRTVRPITGREPQGVQSAPSGGRSTRAQTPSLTRRSGPEPRMSPPRASSPPRTVSPPRSSPPRTVSPPRSSAPPRMSPPRSAPPRSSPPARSGGSRGGGGGRRH